MKNTRAEPQRSVSRNPLLSISSRNRDGVVLGTPLDARPFLKIPENAGTGQQCGVTDLYHTVSADIS